MNQNATFTAAECCHRGLDGWRTVWMRRTAIALVLGAAGVLAGLAELRGQQRVQSDAAAGQDRTLRAPSDFAGIADAPERSRALFREAVKVITSPRCLNCHPAGDHPTQGDNMHPHFPPVARGPDGGGVPGNSCRGCHMQSNTTILAGREAAVRSIPGHPRWGLAPIEMAWQGKSAAEICRQIKDPQRNGGRSLDLLHEHIARDDLIAWGWNPGPGRDPAPGTQERAGELIQAWIETGAECPP